MADPKDVATSEKKEKSSILDDDIGKDVLSSWDLISVTQDTGDFNLEPMGKSKKKDFSFGKMDMDFDLGGDFGKLSSFKMDMSGLDFSFFPKKNKKATETSERDSSRVKNTQGMEDRFNFSFDFNSFDIDAVLSKVDTLSSKQKDIQKHATDITDIEASEVQDNEVTIADILKSPKKAQTSETVEAKQVQVLADNHDSLMAGNHSLRCDTSVDVVSQPGAETASDKAVHDVREKSMDHLCLPFDRPIIHEYDDQSMPTSNLAVGSLMKPQEGGSSSGKIVNENVGGEQSICFEAAADTVQPKSPEFVLPQIAECLEDNTNKNKILSDSNAICIEEPVVPGSDLGGSHMILQNKTSELSQECNDVNDIAINTSTDVKESSDGVSDSHDASVATAVKIQHREMKTQFSPLSSSKPMVDKSPLGKEKESRLMRLKFFGKSNEADKLNHESLVFIQPKSPNVIATRSDCPHETREAITREKPIGNTAEGGFVSHIKVAKGEHTPLRIQRTLITTKENSLNISRSKSGETSNKNESQKSEKANVTSIMDITQSMRHISTAKDKSLPLKSVTRNLDPTALESSRWTAEKKLQPISATTNEIKSFKDLKQKVVEDVTPKVAVLNLTEKQKPETPTLKRKQAPIGGLVHEIPLKRLSQSPINSSICNLSDMKTQGQVQDKNNIMDISPCATSHFVDETEILKCDTPGKMNSSVLEIPLEIGDFGMVEKAAAYGKDLEDLCNMLRKKNEEAKELLVRAVVNNNNLLLLNHPMHEEKIRSVQKLASRLMAIEIASRPI